MVTGADTVDIIEHKRKTSCLDVTTWNTLGKDRLYAVDIRPKRDYNAFSDFPRKLFLAARPIIRGLEP